jgi:dTDP-L-rhamnose 4-epimerase
MNTFKNILITGGAGFIGSNLALKFIKEGFSVTVLDNLSPQIHGEKGTDSPLFKSIEGKVKFMHGSVTCKEDLLKSIENQNIIVHLAAETGTGQSMYEIQKYTDVNISGTALLLDILTNEKHSVQKILIASSRAIYGEGKYICTEHGAVYPVSRSEKDMKTGDFNVKCPICGKNAECVATSEDSKIHPTSVYGISKQVQEQMTLLVGKSIGIPAVSLRYQNVYGPGQSLSNPYTGILSIFSTRIKNNNDIIVFEDGTESRDFVYINDAVDATFEAAVNENADNEIFNVGTGVSVDVMTVAQVLKEKYNSKINIKVSGNFRLGDIRHNFADISKIQKRLNFTPKTDFRTGIEKFTEWVESQEILKDNYEESIQEMKAKGLYK